MKLPPMKLLLVANAVKMFKKKLPAPPPAPPPVFPPAGHLDDPPMNEDSIYWVAVAYTTVRELEGKWSAPVVMRFKDTGSPHGIFVLEILRAVEPKGW